MEMQGTNLVGNQTGGFPREKDLLHLVRNFDIRVAVFTANLNGGSEEIAEGAARVAMTAESSSACRAVTWLDTELMAEARRGKYVFMACR